MPTTVLSSRVEGSNTVESTRIYSVLPDDNYSAAAFIALANYDTGNVTRSILGFPGLAAIPSGDVIDSVTLTMVCMRNDDPPNMTFNLLRILDANVIAEATWNNASSGVPWDTPGAASSSVIDTAPILTITNVAVGSADWSSAGLTAWVQGVVSGTLPNRNLLLALTPLDVNDFLVANFASAQDLTSGPVLTVVHHTPGGGGPTVTTVSSNSATEASPITHTVTLSAATTATTNFAATLTGVTATSSGTDFTSALGSATYSNGVTFSGGNMVVPSGVSSFTVQIATTADTLDEANETYTLTVGGVNGTGTINDDDPLPHITYTSSVTVPAGDDVVITVTLDAPSGRTINATATLTDGTAVGGADYTNALDNSMLSNGVTVSAGVLSIPAGVSSFTVTIPTTA